MQLNSINSTSFQSRSPQIRQADKFLRVVNREFPAISPSKFKAYISDGDKPHIQNTFIDPTRYNKDLYYRYIPKNVQNVFANLHTYLERLRYHYFPLSEKSSTADFYKIFAKSVKGDGSGLFPDKPFARVKRLANCAEMSKIAQMVLGLNGVDSIPVSIKRYGNLSGDKFAGNKEIRTYNLPLNAEHRFVLIPDKGKTLSTDYIEETPLIKLKNCLVFDPWCGFVDTPENAALKYFGEHDQITGHTIKDFMPKPNDKMYHNKMYLVVTSDNEKLKIDEQTREVLRKEFPELIVNKGN